MNKFLSIIMVGGMVVCTLLSCKKKPQSEDIIAPKPVKEVQKGPAKMQEIKQSSEVDWVGSRYKIEIVRNADESLQLVQDESGHRYYDNKITLKVSRRDGSEFFNRTFTKADFAQCLDENFRKDGALLGIVLDRAEENQLRFAASVGSPDLLSDQYIPLVLIVTRMGAVSIARDTRLDTGAEDDV